MTADPTAEVPATAPPLVAVLVAHDPGEWFEETLGSLRDQTYRNLAVLVVDASSEEELSPRIAEVLPEARVHRLDRNVSGAIVVAKTSKAASRLAALFRERDERLRKTYLAWVSGHPSEAATLRHRIRREGGVTRLAAPGDTDGREALLSYRREGHATACARLRVELGTGLPHQIRFQLAFAGFPLEGDVKYGGPPGKRPALHALELAFPHPVGGAPVVLHAPVPKDLRRLDKRRGIEPPLGGDA